MPRDGSPRCFLPLLLLLMMVQHTTDAQQLPNHGPCAKVPSTNAIINLNNPAYNKDASLLQGICFGAAHVVNRTTDPFDAFTWELATFPTQGPQDLTIKPPQAPPRESACDVLDYADTTPKSRSGVGTFPAHHLPFLYSQAFLTDQTSYGSANQLDLTPDGYYTRFAFSINHHNNAQQGVTFDMTFDVTGAQSADPRTRCTSGTTTCPSGQVCDSLSPTRITGDISRPFVQYRMTPAVSSSTDVDYVPFSHLAVNEAGTLAGVCTASTEPGIEKMDNTEPCADTVAASASLTPLAGNCGAMSDDLSNSAILFTATTNCATMCCTGSYHQRWNVSPKCWVYRLDATPEIFVDADFTVTTSAGTRTVQLRRIQVGAAAVDTVGATVNGGPYVRALVNDIFQQQQPVFPIVSGANIVICHENDTVAWPRIFESDPSKRLTNPWLQLPNQGNGSVPTRTNGIGSLLPPGSRYSWAFINQSTAYGPYHDGYGTPQRVLTSEHSGFADPASCNNNYFTNNNRLVDWTFNPATGLPFIESPCQQTDHLNRLNDQYLNGGIPPDQLDGLWYLFPGWTLERPPAWLEGYSVVFQPDFDYTPVNTQYSGTGYAPSDPASYSDSVFGFEVFIDVANALAPVVGNSRSGGFVGGGCYYSLLTGNASVAVSAIDNSDTTSATWDFRFMCVSSNTSLVEVTSIGGQPGNDVTVGPFTFGPGDILTRTGTFRLTNETTEPFSSSALVSIQCGVQMLASAESSLPIATTQFTCSNIDPTVSTRDPNVDPQQQQGGVPTCDNAEWYQVECTGTVAWWLLVGGGIIVASLAVIGIIATFVHFNRARKRKQD